MNNNVENLVQRFPWHSLLGDPLDLRDLREAIEYRVGIRSAVELTYLAEAGVDSPTVEDGDDIAEEILCKRLTYLYDPTSIRSLLKLFVHLAYTNTNWFGHLAGLLHHASQLPELLEELRGFSRESMPQLVELWNKTHDDGAETLAAIVASLQREYGDLDPEWAERFEARWQHSETGGNALGLCQLELELDKVSLARRLREADWRMAAAAAFRMAAQSAENLRGLSDDERAFADEFGMPGLLERYYPFPLEIAPSLLKDVPLAASTEFESVSVIFATETMVVVAHPQKGNFTFKVSETGLKKGDPAEVANFVPPPRKIYRTLRFTKGGETRTAEYT